MEHEQSMQECQKELYRDMGGAVSRAYRRTAQAAGDTCEQAVRYGREHFGASTLMALGMGIGMGLYLGGTYKKTSLASRYGRGASTLIALGIGIGMSRYLGRTSKESRLTHFARPVIATAYDMRRSLFR